LAATSEGILGNLTIDSFAAGSVVISGGLVGDAAGDTVAWISSPKGFIAASGAVNLTHNNPAAAWLLANQTGANLALIQGIFTNSGLPLAFDTGGKLAGLQLIETNLNNLQDNNGVLAAL
jgi:hypothetical protein